MARTRDFDEHAGDGWCSAREHRIVVRSGLGANARIHELAHALGIGYREFGRGRAEVLVDCAAFCVLQTVGLDTAGATVPYIAGWGEDGAPDAVRAFAGRIDEVAKQIEDALAGRLPPAASSA